MTDKSLKNKAIKIKGRDYVLVSDRVTYFNEQYPNGSINTELISDPTSEMIIVKATIIPDVDKPTRTFSDYSQAVIGDGMVNKTAALENASTSAVGRALGYMGIGVIESIASADELNKAQGSTGIRKMATPKQLEWMRNEAARICGEENIDDVDSFIEMVLTIPPTQVPLSKVKAAVDKIKAEGPKLMETVRKEASDQIGLERPDLNNVVY